MTVYDALKPGVGQSNILHHPNDNHTEVVYKMVGRTDRFLFKFQKPAE